MIRYYAYYSCGGYKDLYLGNSTLEAENTYFLPLLAIWQKGPKPEYAEKLKQVDGLHKIEVVTRDKCHDFPDEAKILFSHGGYRVIYLTLSNGDTCLCVRDITNGTTDEEDREIPFNILITASGDEDIKILDGFCLGMHTNINKLYDLFSTLLTYDPYANGIRFNLKKINQALYQTPTPLQGIHHMARQVIFLAVDSKDMLQIALLELNLKIEQVDYIVFNDRTSIGQLRYKNPSSSNQLSTKLPHLDTKPIKPVKEFSMDEKDGNSTSKTFGNEEEVASGEVAPSENHEKTDNEDKKSELPSNLHQLFTSFFKGNNSYESEVHDTATKEKEEELNLKIVNLQTKLDYLLESINAINAKLEDSNSKLADYGKKLDDSSAQLDDYSIKLEDCKSIFIEYSQNILSGIEALEESQNKCEPISPAPAKNENSVTIPKINLWIAGITLIVGILLGALIF